MRSAWIMVLAAACGDGAAAPDARMVDAGPDAISIDARTCGLPSATPPAPPTDSPVVDFGVTLATHDYPVAVLATAERIMVGTHYAIDSTALDGSSPTTEPLAAQGVDRIELGAMVAGAADIGVMVNMFVGTTGTSELCIVDDTGTIDLARCVALGSADTPGTLVFDGVDYDIYTSRNGAVERRTYDSTPTMISDATLPDWGTLGVAGAARSQSSEDVVTYDQSGVGCGRLLEHVQQSDGSYLTRDPAPAAAGVDFAYVASADVGVSIVYMAACFTDGCSITFDQVPLLATTRGAAPGINGAPVMANEYWSGPPIFRDGSDTVVLATYTSCSPDGPSCMKCASQPELSRYAEDGSEEVTHVAIGEVSGQEELGIAGTAIAARDYAIAVYDSYTLTLSRVHVP